MTDDVTCSRILDQLQHTGGPFECMAADTESTGIEFESAQLRNAGRRQSGGFTCRLAPQGPLGASSTTDLADAEGTIERAVEAAAFGDQLDFEFAPKHTGPDVRVYDDRLVSADLTELIEVGTSIRDALVEVDADARIDVSVDRQVQQTWFANSNGQQYTQQQSAVQVSASMERFSDDDIFSVWDVLVQCDWPVNIDTIIKNVADRYKAGRKLVTIDGGTMPVMLAPPVISSALMGLFVALSGKNVATGVSPLQDRLGDSLECPQLTIHDDATLDNCVGSHGFDDEGVPGQRTALIDRGVIRGFYHDLKTAARLGVKPTGNAQRSLHAPPEPSSSNLIIDAGDTPHYELLRKADRMLLVYSLLGVGQGNMLAGDYNTGVHLGFLVEHGSIVGRVKNVSLAGNIYDDLKRIIALENQQHWYGTLCTPHILIDGMSVAV